MKLILRFIKNYKLEAVFAPLFKMLEAIFELFVPLVIASVIDNGITTSSYTHIAKCALLLLILAIVGLLCSLTAQYFSAKAAIGVSSAIRHSLFSHIQSFSFKRIDEMGTGTMITRMTSDINQVQNGVNMTLRLFLRSPFIVFGAMIMAFTIDIKAALIFVVTIPLLAIVVYGIMIITIPMYKRVQKGLDEILIKTRENLTGIRVIRAFTNEDSEISAFKESNDALSDSQKAAGRISALTNPLTFIIINAATITLLYTGATRVDIGILTKGQVVALVNYMSQILVELVKLANLIITITKALACASRIEAVFETDPGMIFPDTSRGVIYSNNTSCAGDVQLNNTYETNSPANTPTDAAAVEFVNVSLSYNTGEEALTGISFKAMPGQTIGIIGGTGSGKSSLVNLIPRFYDATDGHVLINGIDVKTYPEFTLRSKVGFVLQKAVLFKGTIRENMKWGNDKATDDEIISALKASQAWEFIEKKAGHLDFMLEKEGRNLSGGQRQRLSIARALVKDPEILILDDSSSALDFATDAMLRKEIRALHKTTFIVSQRTSSIAHSDLIIVLEDGRQVATGTHDELLKDCSIYREIHDSQFMNVEDGK